MSVRPCVCWQFSFHTIQGEFFARCTPQFFVAIVARQPNWRRKNRLSHITVTWSEGPIKIDLQLPATEATAISASNALEMRNNISRNGRMRAQKASQIRNYWKSQRRQMHGVLKNRKVSEKPKVSWKMPRSLRIVLTQIGALFLILYLAILGPSQGIDNHLLTLVNAPKVARTNSQIHLH